jgi:hypothetical protein
MDLHLPGRRARSELLAHRQQPGVLRKPHIPLRGVKTAQFSLQIHESILPAGMPASSSNVTTTS